MGESVHTRLQKRLTEYYGNKGTSFANLKNYANSVGKETKSDIVTMHCNCPIRHWVNFNSEFLGLPAMVCRSNFFKNKTDYAVHLEQCDNLILFQAIDFEIKIIGYESLAQEEYTTGLSRWKTKRQRIINQELMEVCKKWREKNTQRKAKQWAIMLKRQEHNPNSKKGLDAWPNTETESRAEAKTPLFGTKRRRNKASPQNTRRGSLRLVPQNSHRSDRRGSVRLPQPSKPKPLTQRLVEGEKRGVAAPIMLESKALQLEPKKNYSRQQTPQKGKPVNMGRVKTSYPSLPKAAADPRSNTQATTTTKASLGQNFGPSNVRKGSRNRRPSMARKRSASYPPLPSPRASKRKKLIGSE